MRGLWPQCGEECGGTVLLKALGPRHTFETVRKTLAELWHKPEGWLFQHVATEVHKHGPEAWKTVFPAGCARGRFESLCIWEDHHCGSRAVSPGTSLGLRCLLAAADLGAEIQR